MSNSPTDADRKLAERVNPSCYCTAATGIVDGEVCNGCRPILAALAEQREQYEREREELLHATRTNATQQQTTMHAAAEEIESHWDAHCDAEGFGPTSLVRRLKRDVGTCYPGFCPALRVQVEECGRLRERAEAWEADAKRYAENSDHWRERAGSAEVERDDCRSIVADYERIAVLGNHRQRLMPSGNVIVEPTNIRAVFDCIRELEADLEEARSFSKAQARALENRNREVRELEADGRRLVERCIDRAHQKMTDEKRLPYGWSDRIWAEMRSEAIDAAIESEKGDEE